MKRVTHPAARRNMQFVGLCAALAIAAGVHGAGAAPPPPPGGPHTIYYGGANTAGYPPFTVSDLGELGTSPADFRVATIPNPFAQQTLLQFMARRGEPIRVRVFDTRGRLVRGYESVASRDGRQDVTWDGKSTAGVAVAPGVYFYEVRSGPRTARGRLVFIR